MIFENIHPLDELKSQYVASRSHWRFYLLVYNLGRDKRVMLIRAFLLGYDGLFWRALFTYHWYGSRTGTAVSRTLEWVSDDDANQAKRFNFHASLSFVSSSPLTFFTYLLHMYKEASKRTIPSSKATAAVLLPGTYLPCMDVTRQQRRSAFTWQAPTENRRGSESTFPVQISSTWAWWPSTGTGPTIICPPVIGGAMWRSTA